MAVVAALAGYAITHDPPGVQGDEGFFLVAIRQPEATAFPVQSPFGPLSLMVNSYVGPIKAGAMSVVFRLWDPSSVALRAFGIAALALSGVLFFVFVRRYSPPTLAALSTAALLFDPAYVVTSVLDWGPVALQHVFLLLTLLAAVRAIERRSWRWAFAAGLAAGLGIWDKVLFVFPLAGLAVAFLLFARRRLEWRLPVAAFAGVLLGAAPFVISLSQPHPGESAAELTRFDPASLPVKAGQVRRTLDGTVLRSFVVNTGGHGPSILGGSRTLMAAACIIAIAVLFPVRRSRYGQFAMATLTAAAVAWLSMSLVRDVGLGVHHTILLWPAPYLLLLFTVLAWRERLPSPAPLFTVVLVVVALQNFRVTVGVRQTAMQYGFTSNWTDAQYPLVARLAQRGGTVLLGDWGLADSLYLASNGKLALRMVSDEYWKPAFDDADLANIATRMTGLHQVTVVYRAGIDQFFPHLRATVDQVAGGLALTPGEPESIADRVGTPRFELITYRRP